MRARPPSSLRRIGIVLGIPVLAGMLLGALAGVAAGLVVVDDYHPALFDVYVAKWAAGGLLGGFFVGTVVGLVLLVLPRLAGEEADDMRRYPHWASLICAALTTAILFGGYAVIDNRSFDENGLINAFDRARWLPISIVVLAWAAALLVAREDVRLRARRSTASRSALGAIPVAQQR